VYETIAKSLYFLLNPLSWIFGFLVVAVLKKRGGARMVWAALCFTFIFGNPFLYQLVVRWWEPPMLAYQDIPLAKTAFVMGGALSVDEHVGHFNLGESVDRLLVPYYLLQEGKIENLVVSAARYNQPEKPNHLQLYKNHLGQLGADTSHIFIETRALNTYENALYGKAFLRDHKLLDERPFLLVTSALHMRRSAACFKKQGLNFIAVPVDTHRLESPPKKWMDYFWPGIQTMNRWMSLAKEMVGLLTYQILGYC